MTQGFIENNTKPDGAYDFFNGVAGPKRAWFGMWDHVRGNDVDANGRLAMGRHGWFDEVMRFYDQHLLGVAPSVQDPPVAVETSDGTWRSEAQWPPADASALATPLRPGVVHRRRAEQRHRRRRLAQRPGHLDLLAAAGARRALRGRPEGDGQRDDRPARREPRGRRLRRRLRRPGDPHQPRYLPAAGQRSGRLRPLRRRLEAPGRPPRRRAAHLVELGVVAAPPDAPAGHRELRVDLAAVALVRGRRRDRGRPLDQARLLQGRRSVHGARGDHQPPPPIPSFALPGALGACS